MMRQSGLFGLSDHKMMLSADGDSLEVLARVVDFEAFRATVVSALNYSDRPLCIIRTQIHSCSFVCSGRLLSASRSRRSDQMTRSEEHTSELQSLMRISYAVFCLKKKNNL